MYPSCNGCREMVIFAIIFMMFSPFILRCLQGFSPIKSFLLLFYRAYEGFHRCDSPISIFLFMVPTRFSLISFFLVFFNSTMLPLMINCPCKTHWIYHSWSWSKCQLLELNHRTPSNMEAKLMLALKLHGRLNYPIKIFEVIFFNPNTI